MTISFHSGYRNKKTVTTSKEFDCVILQFSPGHALLTFFHPISFVYTHWPPTTITPKYYFSKILILSWSTAPFGRHLCLNSFSSSLMLWRTLKNRQTNFGRWVSREIGSQAIWAWEVIQQTRNLHHCPGPVLSTVLWLVANFRPEVINFAGHNLVSNSTPGTAHWEFIALVRKCLHDVCPSTIGLKVNHWEYFSWIRRIEKCSKLPVSRNHFRFLNQFLFLQSGVRIVLKKKKGKIAFAYFCLALFFVSCLHCRLQTGLIVSDLGLSRTYLSILFLSFTLIVLCIRTNFTQFDAISFENVCGPVF